MKLVKFTRSREELDPAKKAKVGADKMADVSFDVYVNVDDVSSVDCGGFGQSHENDPIKTTIHLKSGSAIKVDEPVEEVVSTLDEAA